MKISFKEVIKSNRPWHPHSSWLAESQSTDKIKSISKKERIYGNSWKLYSNSCSKNTIMFDIQWISSCSWWNWRNVPSPYEKYASLRLVFFKCIFVYDKKTSSPYDHSVNRLRYIKYIINTDSRRKLHIERKKNHYVNSKYGLEKNNTENWF